MFENSKIMITGGTGSWGHVLTKTLLQKNPKEIVIFSRGEFAQVTMKREFNDSRLKFIIGDVADYESVRHAIKGVDYVFHLAALKHVPVCESQPYEAIKTNVLGSLNVTKAAIEAQVKKVIDVSSDKAVDPLNSYGITKALGERLFINANSRDANTKFICIRAGNVAGTSGSVIPFWKRQISEDKKIKVTSFDMTRYYLKLDEAINLVLKAAEFGMGGETFVTRMPSIIMKDLARIMFKFIKNRDMTDDDYEIIGLQAGEKMHELLISRNEAERTRIFGDDYFVILPYFHIDSEIYYNHLPKFDKSEYGSNTQDFMKDEEVLAFLKEIN